METAPAARPSKRAPMNSPHKANGSILTMENRAPLVSAVREGIDGLFTGQEVADILKVSYEWVWEHATGRKRPKLPCVRLGSMLRFRREDLARFIQENCQ